MPTETIFTDADAAAATTIAAAKADKISPWAVTAGCAAGCAAMFLVPFVGTIARNLANRVVPLHTTFTVTVPGGVVSPPKG